MKKIYFSLVAIFAMAFMSVNAQVILTENFDYPSGDSIKAHGWAQTSAWTNPVSVASPGLTYAGYSANAGNCVAMANTGQDVNKQFASSYTSGSVYASFLINVSAAQAVGDYFFHFAEAASTSVFKGKVIIKKDATTDKFAFGISKGTNITQTAPNTPVLSSYSYDYNTTYLVVVKYTINAGADNDVAALFVNPVLGASEPTATITSVDQLSTQADPANIGAICLRQGSSANAATLKIDGIIIGQTWNDVTVTGIFNTASKSNAYVFPNPVKNVLTVKNAQNVNRVEISNIIGEKLISESFNSNNSIDVSSLFNGIYFVTLYNDNQAVKTVKFIKE